MELGSLDSFAPTGDIIMQWLWLIILVIVVAAGLVIFGLLRRRRKSEDDGQGGDGPDGGDYTGSHSK